MQTEERKFLYIKSVNRTHAGNYICVSLSPDGNHSSPITTVDVLCEFLLYLDVVRTERLPNKFIFNIFLIFWVSHGTQKEILSSSMSTIKRRTGNFELMAMK